MHINRRKILLGTLGALLALSNVHADSQVANKDKKGFIRTTVGGSFANSTIGGIYDIKTLRAIRDPHFDLLSKVYVAVDAGIYLDTGLNPLSVSLAVMHSPGTYKPKRQVLDAANGVREIEAPQSKYAINAAIVRLGSHTRLKMAELNSYFGLGAGKLHMQPIAVGEIPIPTTNESLTPASAPIEIQAVPKSDKYAFAIQLGGGFAYPIGYNLSIVGDANWTILTGVNQHITAEIKDAPPSFIYEKQQVKASGTVHCVNLSAGLKFDF